MSLHVVIPAGGHGTRLWPLSQAGKPKFLLDVGTGEPLICDAVGRALAVASPEDVLVVTGLHHAPLTASTIGVRGLPAPVVEPTSRNTTAALALATCIVGARDPEAVIVSLPADHLVRATGPEWEQAVARAAAEAAAGRVAVVGVRPTSAHTGYGYVQADHEQPTVGGGYRVSRFREKPERSIAQCYVESGDHYWNTAISAWSARTFTSLLRGYAPDIMQVADQAARAWLDAGAVPAALWAEIRSVAIEYALMEPAAADGLMSVVPASFQWRDVGNWAGVAEVLDRPPASNVLTVDAKGSTVLDFAEGQKKRRYALLGAPDLVVVDTGDVVLIMPRSAAEQVKDIAAAAREQGWLDPA